MKSDVRFVMIMKNSFGGMMMNIEKRAWHGYRIWNFEFEGMPAVVVEPKKEANGKWLLKTEYFEAFPEFEFAMLEQGYYVAHVDNQSRWCLPTDTVRQAHFAHFLHNEFHFHEKCLPVGLSCGGMQAVYLAGMYPEVVAALYLDAPVLNFLSCPGRVGKSTFDYMHEFTAETGMTIETLINYRAHPIDYVPRLIAAKIPTMLVCGDSDVTVPYDENGKVLAEMFNQDENVPFLSILKSGCDHHPHGLENPAPLVEFAMTHY